jgi:hypothetical protein
VPAPWPLLENGARDARKSQSHAPLWFLTSCGANLPVVYRHDTGTIVIFIELKSRRGLASKAQKQVRLEMLPVGAKWWMARSARAAMMALCLSGVVFRREWKPSRLEPWEGPFADPTQRLPRHPKVADERREAKRRSRERQRARRAAKLAAERDDASRDVIAA